METYSGFKYKDIDEIQGEAKALNLDLNFSKNIDILKSEVLFGNHVTNNSIAIHPMEGCDSEPDGRPGELTKRRYDRFAKSGAGLIWFEAVAIAHEARANPRQLYITESNCDDFSKLSEDILNTAYKDNKGNFSPLLIMQITHSGRYSKPEGTSRPILAAHDPYLDKKLKIDADYPVITDDELERLEDKFLKTAIHAKKAGFHGVDIKSCHRYLISELLSAHTRKGKYGGTFDGRTKFIRNVFDKIKTRLGKEFIVTSRINIYDGIPYPYGFGVNREDFLKYDLTDPIELIGELNSKGMDIVNLTMGNPYYNPHVNRPFEKNDYAHIEHPLTGVARLINGIGEVQKAIPQIAVVGTGYSFSREFSSYLAAGSLEDGKAKIVGFGREAFAYPDFAKDILIEGRMKKEKCCIACGKCSEIMKFGGRAGCVIRDAEVYGKIYKEAVSRGG